MSVTATSDSSRATRAQRLFDDLLFSSPEVCSHCFARIRDHAELEADPSRLGTGNRPTETLERVGDGEIGQDVETHDSHGVRRSYHARTFCGVCGTAGGTAIGDRIHSLQALRGCLDRIVRRLHEAGYYPHLPTLYGTAIRLKSKPAHQGRDREILATAVYLALSDDTDP